jgi:hypothetical protein
MNLTCNEEASAWETFSCFLTSILARSSSKAIGENRDGEFSSNACIEVVVDMVNERLEKKSGHWHVLPLGFTRKYTKEFSHVTMEGTVK